MSWISFTIGFTKPLKVQCKTDVFTLKGLVLFTILMTCLACAAGLMSCVVYQNKILLFPHSQQRKYPFSAITKSKQKGLNSNILIRILRLSLC